MGDTPATPSPAERRAAFERAKASLTPVEVAVAPRFRTMESLVVHVRKHVLDSRDERWKELLDPGAIHEARAADVDRQRADLPATGPLKRLAEAYQTVVGGALRDACQAGVGHGHLGGLSLNDDGEGFSVARHTVMAWDRTRRMVIVASALVREGMVRPYKIRTGFRNTGRLSDQRFAARWRARLKERARTRGETIVAIHDQDAAEAHRPRQGQHS